MSVVGGGGGRGGERVACDTEPKSNGWLLERWFYYFSFVMNRTTPRQNHAPKNHNKT